MADIITEEPPILGAEVSLDRAEDSEEDDSKGISRIKIIETIRGVLIIRRTFLGQIPLVGVTELLF